jgi:ABC-type antimicrobial peptide transport system permease subunit
MRSATPPVTQLDPVRQVLRRIEPAAGAEVATLYSSIGLAFLPSQIGAVLLGSIGLLGLLLAAVGLYGVMVYTVARRTREIGVRVAIGASRSEITRMVLIDSLKLVAAGSVAGLAIAVFITKPLAMFLVPGLTPTDPLSFSAVVAVLILTSLAATWGPVRRALAIDPVTSLRYE